MQKRYETTLMVSGIRIGDVFKEILHFGAASRPALTEDFRIELLKEAERHSFIPEAPMQGKPSSLVYQEMGTFSAFPAGSGFLSLKNAFEDFLLKSTASLPTNPFSGAFSFNAATLACYPAGSLGITPHRDGLGYKNLICIFIIGGKGRFFICDDRAGKNAKEIDAVAGNIIFMRAPGFYGTADNRPFHFVTNITETRYSFALRQEVRSAA